jgi:CHAD domain-containing protein
MAANMTETVTRPEQTPSPRLFAAGTQPRRSACAGDVVLAYLRIQAAELISLEPAVRADEPDSVHQMRVAARRLRATLRTFGRVIPRSRSEQVAGELKWLGRLLGAARDGEVLAAHLRASLRRTPSELVIGPVQARVQGYYAPRRAAARAELLEALDSPRYVALLAGLDQLCHEPPTGPQATAPARDVLPPAVRRAYRQAAKRMRRANHTPPGPSRDTALHQARKSARRARYAAEATRPPVGQRPRHSRPPSRRERLHLRPPPRTRVPPVPPPPNPSPPNLAPSLPPPPPHLAAITPAPHALSSPARAPSDLGCAPPRPGCAPPDPDAAWVSPSTSGPPAPAVSSRLCLSAPASGA